MDENISKNKGSEYKYTKCDNEVRQQATLKTNYKSRCRIRGLQNLEGWFLYRYMWLVGWETG